MLLGVLPTCVSLSSAAEGSPEDLGGCVVGGLCKVELGVTSLSLLNTVLLEAVCITMGLPKRILFSVPFQRGH